MTHNPGETNSIFNRYIRKIRDKEIQKDSMRFRRNLERIGEIFAYEISKSLSYNKLKVTTPLGETDINLPSDKIVAATVLRAGLPMHKGVLNVFDDCENAFVSAYRKYDKTGDFNIEIEYMSGPSLDGKILILIDPMLATGASMLLAYKALLSNSDPLHTHFVTAIASIEGVSYLKRNTNNDNCSLWVGAIDEELTSKSYIVPGLGDAGDLAFGPKYSE